MRLAAILAPFRGQRQAAFVGMRVSPGTSVRRAKVAVFAAPPRTLAGLPARAHLSQYRGGNNEAAAERAVMAQLRVALDIHRRDYFDDEEPRRAAE